MKNLILLFACLVALSARGSDTKCITSLQHAGIFYNECPLNMAVTGTDVRVSGNPPFPFVTVIVECAKLVTTCTSTKDSSNGKTGNTRNNY
jgi:hypothetical protein